MTVFKLILMGSYPIDKHWTISMNNKIEEGITFQSGLSWWQQNNTKRSTLNMTWPVHSFLFTCLLQLFHNEQVIKTFNLLNFLKFNGITHLIFLELSIFVFRDIKIKTWSWSANRSYDRAWSDVQAGLAIYWWQRLITFDSGWIRVNYFNLVF